METIIEQYIPIIRNLIEENEIRSTFDDDLQMIKEKFDDSANECEKKLIKNLNSSSCFLIENVKEKLSRLINDKAKQCLKEIKMHIEWSIQQRKEIRLNANKKAKKRLSQLNL